MSNKKDTGWLFLFIGVIVGIIFMNLKNKKEVPIVIPPFEIPIKVKNTSFVYIVDELREMSVDELTARLERITKIAVREHPDDIRGSIEEQLEDLIRDFNTGKIILDL